MEIKLKIIKNRISINKYKISFSYETYKGYYREQEREINAVSSNQAKEVFNNWKKSIRTMSNAKILGIAKLQENIQIFEV